MKRLRKKWVITLLKLTISTTQLQQRIQISNEPDPSSTPIKGGVSTDRKELHSLCCIHSSNTDLLCVIQAPLAQPQHRNRGSVLNRKRWYPENQRNELHCTQTERDPTLGDSMWLGLLYPRGNGSGRWHEPHFFSARRCCTSSSSSFHSRPFVPYLKSCYRTKRSRSGLRRQVDSWLLFDK